MPLRAKFTDSSRLLIGCQSFQNQLGSLFSTMSFNWINELKLDNLRISLKKEFFIAK
jgi:hypothetical protein